MQWIETLINGLLLGGLYGLIGIGLALVFGVMRLVNVAHGEFIVLAALLATVLTHELPGVHPLWLVLPVALICFAVGWVLQRGLINRVVSAPDPIVPMLFTFGLSVVLRNSMVATVGADPRGLDGGAIVQGSIELFGLRIGTLPLLVLVVGVTLFLVLQMVVSRTRFGRIVRATADNAEVVQLMGVKPESVYAIVMGMALALAAVAGVLLAMRTSFTPFSGTERLLLAFEVVIIGGMGSLWGALVGGMVLGVAQLVGLRLMPESGPLLAHLAFLLVLFFKPTGLAGKRA